MPFDGIPPAGNNPPAQLVEHMLWLLATRDNWLRNKEKELGKDGVLRVCLLGAFKLSMRQLPRPVQRSAGRVVRHTLNEVICDLTRPNDFRAIKRLTRLGVVKNSLMVAFNDNGCVNYYDVITILQTTRARVQPASVMATV